jgi:hypothetical protein
MNSEMEKKDRIGEEKKQKRDEPSFNEPKQVPCGLGLV